MSKHILDRTRRRSGLQMSSFAAVTRRSGPEGSNPAAKYIMRRAKGPWNAALRYRAFLRIERGQDV